MDWRKPETEAVRAALRVVAPRLADKPISPFAEGWEAWAFEAGGYVIRFPKNDASVRSLRLDRALLPDLRRYLSVPVPSIEIWGEAGPNGAPFAGHRMLPGTPVWPTGGKASQAQTGTAPQPSANFGRDFGRLLWELHSFPVERALEIGVPLHDAAFVRAKRIEHFETVVRRVFPLLNCETRTFVESMYERALNDRAFYEFEPRLAHGDLDVNTLIDESGNITGVIDFGQVFVGSAAIDYWLPVYGFEKLGIGEQSGECLAAAGIDEADLARMRPELEFIDFQYPILDILYGLDHDPDYVEEGIRELNTRVPPGVVCVEDEAP